LDYLEKKECSSFNGTAEDLPSIRRCIEDVRLWAFLLPPIPLLLIFGVITTTLPELLPFLFFFSPSL
jgi:hypothetical protein